jgi:sulfur-carrier protein
MVRVVLPYHLRNLAKVGKEVAIETPESLTIATVLDALEAAHPNLKGTIRDHTTKARRPFLRFFVCGEDWSLEPADRPLPEAIGQGREPFMVIGAIAGG